MWTSGKPQTFKSPETLIAETLTGARIRSVRRVGKTIVMSVERADGEGASREAEFLIHLGMTGRLLVSQAEVPVPLHTHAVLGLDDGARCGLWTRGGLGGCRSTRARTRALLREAAAKSR